VHEIQQLQIEPRKTAAAKLFKNEKNGRKPDKADADWIIENLYTTMDTKEMVCRKSAHFEEFEDATDAKTSEARSLKAARRKKAERDPELCSALMEKGKEHEKVPGKGEHCWQAMKCEFLCDGCKFDQHLWLIEFCECANEIKQLTDLGKRKEAAVQLFEHVIGRPPLENEQNFLSEWYLRMAANEMDLMGKYVCREMWVKYHDWDFAVQKKESKTAYDTRLAQQEPAARALKQEMGKWNEIERLINNANVAAVDELFRMAGGDRESKLNNPTLEEKKKWFVQRVYDRKAKGADVDGMYRSVKQTIEINKRPANMRERIKQTFPGIFGQREQKKETTMQ